jgi:hypothetical protein
MEHCFGVTVRLKSVTARLEYLANLEMVVDLSVEDDRIVAVFRVDGLIARRQVNDFETSGAEIAPRGLVNALLVGSAMKQGFRCLPDALRTG